MTKTRRATLVAVTLALTLGAGAPTPLVRAAPPTPADGMCSLLTPREIKGVFPKGRWQVADDGEEADACSLHNGLFDRAAQSLLVKVVPSTEAAADSFFADLRAGGAGGTDAVDADVDGSAAVYVPFSEGASLYVRAAPDWWFTVETGDTLPNLQEKLVSLATIVAGRLGLGGASASPAPLASPAGTQLCAIVSLEEVAAAVGEPVTVSADEADRCSLAGDATVGSGTSLVVTYLTGDPMAISTLEEQARETFPDAPEGTVLGVPALFPDDETTDGGLLRASIQLLPDPVTWIALTAEVPVGVDAGGGVLDLAESVVARLGMATGTTTVPDDGASSSPAPSGDLVSRFPAEIGGSALEVQPARPLDLMNLPIKLERKLTKALKAQGVTLDDASFAVGATADGTVAVIAFRVEGADVRPLAGALVAGIGGKRLKEVPSSAIVGAREAFLVEDSNGTRGYAHPSGDVLWLVFSLSEDSIADAFAVLP